MAEARHKAADELEAVQRQFRAYQAAKGQEIAQLDSRLRSALSSLDGGAARKEKDGSGGLLQRSGLQAAQGVSRTGKRKFQPDLSLHDGRFASSLLPQGGAKLLNTLANGYFDRRHNAKGSKILKQGCHEKSSAGRSPLMVVPQGGTTPQLHYLSFY